ncbi:MAG TPA: 3-deoxy-7-phosphoheptulonate synthase, partial [Microbacterium sp.]|nr:3-deoxy-7-phosphoheptulonate synthase [Microbacterium sp.]
LGAQIATDGAAIAGVMLESNLVAGAQKLDVAAGRGRLTYGQSVTDACMDWDSTVTALAALANGVRGRRAAD